MPLRRRQALVSVLQAPQIHVLGEGKREIHMLGEGMQDNPCGDGTQVPGQEESLYTLLNLTGAPLFRAQATWMSRPGTPELNISQQQYCQLRLPQTSLAGTVAYHVDMP